MGLILLILLIFLLLGAFPRWPYNRDWGYNPFAIIAVIVIIYLLLAFSGHILIL